MLKLTFLGTSAGVPTKQRNVTALAVESLNPYASNIQNTTQSKKSRPWVLVDCGEGTQQQLLHTKLSLHQLQAICITHGWPWKRSGICYDPCNRCILP